MFGLTRLVVMLTGLAVTLELVRKLPESTYLDYRVIWSTVSIAVAASNLGLPALITRRVARENHQAGQMVWRGLQTVGVLALPTTLAIVGYIALASGEWEVVLASVFGALTLTGNAAAQVVQGGLHGLRRMRLEVSATLLGRGLFAGGTLALLAWGSGLVALYMVRAAAAWLTAVVLLRQLVRVAPGTRWRIEPEAVRGLLRDGRTFGATVFFGAVYAQADLLVLDWLRDDLEGARYAAPASVLLQLALVATVVSRGIFPLLAKSVGDVAKATDIVAFQSRVLLLLGVPVAVGGIATASEFVPWVLGEKYATASVGPFLLLVAAVPVRFLNNGLGVALTALDMQPQRARIDRFGAAFNVMANLAVVPMWGAEGAAATTLATDLVLLGMLRWRLGDALPDLDLRGVAVRTVLPALGMAAVLWGLPSVHVALDVLVGAAAYLVLARISGGWRLADLRRLRRV